MKLTKEQKLQCYKGALEDLIRDNNGFGAEYGICTYLSDQLLLTYKISVKHDTEFYSMFPEFAAYKPNEWCLFWFENNEQRIEVLTKIITDLENDSNKKRHSGTRDRHFINSRHIRGIFE